MYVRWVGSVMKRIKWDAHAGASRPQRSRYACASASLVPSSCSINAALTSALMLHEDGTSEAEAHAYLERWGLEAPAWASHLIRFITEPTQRTYILTYSAGRELCSSYVATDSDRFRRLLTEQVRVGDLREARGTDAR